MHCTQIIFLQCDNTHSPIVFTAKWYLCHSEHQWVRASVRACSPELSTIQAHQMTSCVALRKCHTCVITCRVWCKNLPVPVLTSVSENECEYILSWVEYYLGPPDDIMCCTQKVFYECDNMQGLVQKTTCATPHKCEWEWAWVHTALSWVLSGPLRWQYVLHSESVTHVW